VSLLSTQPISRCPLCGSPAARIHSRYQRRLADLPSAGQPVRFLLSVRKFFCGVQQISHLAAHLLLPARESLNVFIDAGVGLVCTHAMMILRIQVLLPG
jgi:DNA-directed RNA polymerase subunit N (RpoN/RPB10)